MRLGEGRVLEGRGCRQELPIEPPQKSRWQDTFYVGGYAVMFSSPEFKPLPHAMTLDDDGYRAEGVFLGLVLVAKELCQHRHIIGLIKIEHSDEDSLDYKPLKALYYKSLMALC